MKKRKVAAPVWTQLPPDVVMKIAFFILDPSELFDFLEVLRPYNVLGPLEHLHTLGLANKHAELWPSLYLTSAILKSSERSSYEAIARYYSNVVVDDISDGEWLKCHLNPMADIEWICWKLPIPTGTLDKCTDLKITRLYCKHYSQPSSDLKAALSRLENLTSLGLCITGPLDYVYEFAAKSKKLTELRITTLFIDEDISTSLRNIIKWFNRQPVRHFKFHGTILWSYDDEGVKHAFHQALFNCPTLEKLALDAMSLEGMDFTNITLKMKSLELSGPDSDLLSSLANRLEGANITDLSIHGLNNKKKDGMKNLLQVLPRTSIKRLKLWSLGLDRRAWCELAPLFQNCQLESLELFIEKFDSEFAQKLTTAVGNNQTICEINLGPSGIALQDLQGMIEGVTHPGRLKRMKRIKWSLRKRQKKIDASSLAALKQFAFDRGCEAVFQYTP
ncbi:hypothetical protein AC1031_011224 [Aphanomyces cochlioides]|nr:hypothetical protein AC1031_011224 [Aphanomyces cochlioides]